MIQAFNDMQVEVAEEVKRRTQTLAAISHDVRSPLTALRLKAELVDDVDVRRDLLASIAKMERITIKALEYLKRNFRQEEMKRIHLCSLVESVCAEFADSDEAVLFSCAEEIEISCRPGAISRAIYNLIENTAKYSGAANVNVIAEEDRAVISVSNQGPGIKERELRRALDAFQACRTHVKAARVDLDWVCPL